MDFKDMNLEAVESRLAELDSMVETASEVETINQATEERKALLERKAELQELEQRKADAKAIEEGKAKEAKIIEERKELKTMEKTPVEIRNSHEYIEAFAKYCKTGDATECRTLLSDNTVSGTVAVPTFVADIVAEKYKASKILSRVRKMNVAGNVKVGFEISAPAAGAHVEGGDPIAEEALELGVATLIPTTYKKWVAISDESLDAMSGEAYLTYVYEEIARGLVKARENAVVAAILAAPQVPTATQPAVAKTGSAMGALTDIIDARALLSSAAEDIVVIVTPAQYAQYKGLAIAANYAVDPFDGLEVLFNDTVTAPIVGDLNGILENLPKGDAPQIKYDDKTSMKADLVNILGRTPAAIGVVGNKFFAKVSA